MIERNGPGGMKTESLSTIIKSGVATPKHARSSIKRVIAIAATRPASNPAENALALLIACRSYKFARGKEHRVSQGTTASKPSLLGDRDAQQRRYDARAGGACPAQRARDFRFATRTAAMVHWNLQNAQPGLRRFHLHLQIPAVGFLFHRQSLQCVAPDRAKWTHVGITNAVKQA